MTTPARRLSPAVYRRRRLVVLLAVVGLAVLVGVIVAQPWRGLAADTAAIPTRSADAVPATSAPPVFSTPPTSRAATPPPTADTDAPPPEPAPTTPAEPEPVAACTAAELTIEAVTDRDSYGPGENPQFSIRLTNRATTDCAMNVGTATQAFVVTSGQDVWWRSTDCQSEPADQIVLLAAGQAVSSAVPLTWDRTRSAVDTCGTGRQAAPGGGATYRLAVSIGGVTALEPAVFSLY